MVKKGDVVVAKDPDLCDMYYCEVVREDEENRKNILCRVLSMAQYPIQHAILDGSIPNENPPLPQGAVCRLRFIRHVETPDKWHHNYEGSVDRCLAEYFEKRKSLYAWLADRSEQLSFGLKRPDKREFEIIERHRHRDFRARRIWINH